MNNLTETLLNKSTTAHIIGGCPPGHNPQNSVVNDKFMIHGFPGLYVLDSSVLPCNPGVNPSLSILAIAEYAMSLIPNKDS
jgi:cholesterol oxidase